MIHLDILLISQGLLKKINLFSSVPIGVFVIVGVIALLVTLAFILSPRGSRKGRTKRSIFRK